ncbi:hypothetical protein RV00_GL002140 [Enterococcus devriesei]|uniref:Phosphoglycerate mutase n=1 Tax=Enterococcus devriesei TaxID=319970 RepID=A0A1L8SVN0_9ENTE|nr:histidine phosphatase family protein [Enterococcus devriesei]OJG35996.1 hypothetical protein RV00_GL002140 [Enterococcus devriesei]
MKEVRVVTVFYFVRHGKTEINAAGRFNGGSVDSPLIPEGVQATKKIGEYLREVSFDVALSSPQMRAQTTTKLILQENLQPPELRIVEDLRELRIGDWDGKRITEIKERFPEQFRLYREAPDQFDAKLFHGESYAELITRSRRVLEETAKAYPNEKVLVVSHGILLMALLNTLKGIPLAKIREGGIVDNSSLTVLHYSKNECLFEMWGKTF